MILVYDGTFEGFLSLVYEVYYEKLKPIKIYKTLPNEMIFEEIKTIETMELNSIKVLNAIKAKFPKDIVCKILNIFMCDTKEFELELLEYIIVVFKHTKQLLNINIQSVFYLNNLEKELFKNVHKMTNWIACGIRGVSKFRVSFIDERAVCPFLPLHSLEVLFQI